MAVLPSEIRKPNLVIFNLLAIPGAIHIGKEEKHQAFTVKLVITQGLYYRPKGVRIQLN